MLRILLKLLYWLAVLAISLALVVALILFFESRDQSRIEGGAATGTPFAAAQQARVRLAPEQAGGPLARRG